MPAGERAYIPTEKLTGYLLAEEHPVGGSKARWLRTLGYDFERAVELETQLLEIARTQDVVETTSPIYGTRYVIDGDLAVRAGRPARIRTVWMVDRGEERPRLITAHPA